MKQTKYAMDLLQKTNMSHAKPNSMPMCTSNKLYLNDSPPFDQLTLYRSTIGALQYLTLTSPDIAFSVNKLSQFLQAPTTLHWSTCKRILRYIKGTPSQGLTFSPARIMILHWIFKCRLGNQSRWQEVGKRYLLLPWRKSCLLELS